MNERRWITLAGRGLLCTEASDNRRRSTLTRSYAGGQSGPMSAHVDTVPFYIRHHCVEMYAVYVPAIG